jgi:hypothetical protein
MGRVSAATDMVTGAAQTLSMAVGASLIAIVNYKIMFVVIAAALLTNGGVLWHRRGVEPIAVPEGIGAASGDVEPPGGHVEVPGGEIRMPSGPAEAAAMPVVAVPAD